MAVDKLKYASGNSPTTTLSSAVSDSDTGLPLTSDSNFAAKAGEGMVIVDEGEATEELAYATGKTGSSLDTPVANRGLEGTSAAGHDSGASVKGVITAGMWNDFIAAAASYLLDKTAGTLALQGPTGVIITDILDEDNQASDSAAALATQQSTKAYSDKVGFPDYIINGSFDIWQRGTSFSSPSDGAYLADRWVNQYDGSGSAFTVSRQSMGAQTTVPGNPTYYLKYNQGTAGTGGSYRKLGQRVENLNRFSEKTVTLSFWAKAASAITVPTNVDYNYGSGGSSSEFGQHQQSNDITTSWQRFTHTITLNDLSAKTIGAGSYLQINFALPVNSTPNLDIAQVQLDLGTGAAKERERNFDEEIVRCLRYFEKSNDYDTAPADQATETMQYFGHAYATNTLRCLVNYRIEKRTAPTVTLYRSLSSSTAGRWAYYTGSGWADPSAVGPISSRTSNFTVNHTLTATALTMRLFSGHWTADAEL